MQLSRNVRLAVGALLALHLAGSVAAIALLGRMEPAIEEVLKDRVRSIAVVEQMLAAVATIDEPGADRAFSEAHGVALASAINAEDRARLERLRQHWTDAAGGSAAARSLVVRELTVLGRTHREELSRVQVSAQRLGSGGAWAVVLVALLTLAGALVALRRLDRRVLMPMEELHDVLLARRGGDEHRRCQRGGAAGELQQAMDVLNRVLDERHDAVRTATAAEQVVLTGGDEADRATMLLLLDADSRPLVVVDGTDDVVAANKTGLDVLAEHDGEITAAEVPEGVVVTAVAGTSRHLLAWPGDEIG